MSWKSNAQLPKHDTKAFVLWKNADRLHTCTWLGDRWITSAGYHVPGMDEVHAWMEQPTVEEVKVALQRQL